MIEKTKLFDKGYQKGLTKRDQDMMRKDQEEEDELKSFVSEHGAATDWQATEHAVLITCSVSTVLCCVPIDANHQPHVTA